MAETKKALNNLKEKKPDRNASPSAYGWCFQVGAGISLILDTKYLKNFSELKLEGERDDIEITLDSGGKVYAQAKSVTQIGNQKSASKNLTDALTVLGEDESRGGDAIKLIYITNINNPLSSADKSAFEYGGKYDFSILSDDDQKTIKDKSSATFPTDKFQLRILRFFGNGDVKFDKIKEQIAEFLQSAIGNPSFNQRLLESWFHTFMVNAADKPDNEKKLTLTLKKRDVIFPVIAVVIDPPIGDLEFAKVCDYDNYNEVVQEFRNTISEKTCDYQFITEVLADYREKKKTAAGTGTYKYDFTNSEWKTYENKFARILSAEKREALVKILLLTIITHNMTIQNIKEVTKLL